MSKERLAAFTDGVFAIIITILVLGLYRPTAINADELIILAERFFCYTLAFFWLGSIWVHLHNSWERVERISQGTIWWSIIFLFFTSLVPHANAIMDDHFYDPISQILYGIVVCGTVITYMLLNRQLYQINPQLATSHRKLHYWLIASLLVILIGMGLSLTIYPASVSFAVLASLLFVMIPSHFYVKNHQA
ncbi:MULTISPECIES: TMEM175 family protein [Glaesserella]|uniref:DUF1211 domain-containing protein n=1 Tax=Glaesserella australis TaxID=2094024 RepID=A0A328BXA0_9PAST|nr:MULTISPECIES: TMEM175 family protein [Glaesserella]AUI66005.1 hypothetical protein CJD39_05185 [Glaesserella sp. 15-184]RAL18275.1 hypothetical protein C5N92_08615 [Glaesserella australis]